MSSNTIFNLLYALFFLSLAGVLWRLTRSLARDTEQGENERAGMAVWDSAAEKWIRLAPGVEPGPGQMTGREVEDADQLELLWLVPAFDPELAAGRARLQQAIDDDIKGDQP